MLCTLFNILRFNIKIKIILKFLKPVLYFKCKKFKIYNYAYKYRKDKEIEEFINDNFYLNVLFDSKIEAYKNELYNEIVSIKNKLNFLNY